MSLYEILKLIHVLSATLILGTGLGTAYFLWMAHLSGDIHTLRKTAHHAILADWIFTTPAVVVQPITGVLLMNQLGWSFQSFWFITVVVLYLVVGACWIPVVFIQYRLRRFAEQVAAFSELPREYFTTVRIWISLGVPAFVGVLALYVLMIFKPMNTGISWRD